MPEIPGIAPEYSNGMYLPNFPSGEGEVALKCKQCGHLKTASRGAAVESCEKCYAGQWEVIGSNYG